MAEFVVLRQTHFNGVLIESDRLVNSANRREKAESIADRMQESVMKIPALRGLTFTFYVRELNAEF